MSQQKGQNLYALRKNAKLSQEELAVKLFVSRQAVSKWERGEASKQVEKQAEEICLTY